MARCIACGASARVEYVTAPRPGDDNRPILYVDVKKLVCEGSCGRIRLDFRTARPYREGVIPRFLPTRAALERQLQAAERFNGVLVRVGLLASLLLSWVAVLALSAPLALRLAGVALIGAFAFWVYRAMGRKESLPEYYPIPPELVAEAVQTRERIEEAKREATGVAAVVAAPAAKPAAKPAAAAEAKAEAAPAGPVETVPMKVRLNGQLHELNVGKGENMLDAALDRNVEIDYSCREGMCDSCVVKILAGAENLSPPTPEEHDMLGDEIKNGLRLACQVRVNGPVEIEQNH